MNLGKPPCFQNLITFYLYFIISPLTASFTNSFPTIRTYFMFSCPLQFLLIKQVNDLFYWGTISKLYCN